MTDRAPRTVGVGLAETSRLIRAAAQRRSAERRNQDAVVEERLAARRQPSATSPDRFPVRPRSSGAASGAG